MDKKTMSMLLATVAVVLVAFLISAKPADNTLTKVGKTTIVNTTTIGRNIKGFAGNTPVKIYIKKNKIEKIETESNQENPQYFARAKKLLTKYQGMSVKKAVNTEVDGVSGATYSSDALKKNVKLGLEYYQKHK